MKKIFVILMLLALFLTACNQVQEDKADLNILSEEVSEPNDLEIQTESEVRLTAEGFDATEIAVKQEESLTILIVDDDMNGHFLSIDGDRIAEKELANGEKLIVSFDTAGKIEITDETSKGLLIVNVI